MQRLTSQIFSTKLLPHPSCSLSTEQHQGKDIVVVKVSPYPVPPSVKVNGVPWVRVSATTRRATDADATRLNERRPHHSQPFDIRPLGGAGLDDLDRARLESEYSAGGIDDQVDYPAFEAWLGQKDLARRVGGSWTPSAAGILVYGVDPQAFLPGAVIEFARYAGEDIDSPIVTARSSPAPSPFSSNPSGCSSRLTSRSSPRARTAHGLLTSPNFRSTR